MSDPFTPPPTDKQCFYLARLIKGLVSKHIERKGGEQPYEGAIAIANLLIKNLDKNGITLLISRLSDLQQDEYHGQSRHDETLALLKEYGIDTDKHRIK